MITLYERLLSATFVALVGLILFGVAMSLTDLSLYPSMVGFVLGVYGWTLVSHKRAERDAAKRGTGR